ncbi:hypothetical protein AU099_gp05 [Gordonia phage GTE8]|uniref:Uncharacterized protein n=1 Tax=Gordonia phage GTE8 TaxID=1647475 RepID=A0A0K0N6G8_9CAUD|nr:hypothetical protein AU099_gp05 [Gordonia phage GTE8]AKJ72348.1 hypothetical protein GTE8_5 [Gordonia phage GTE8]
MSDQAVAELKVTKRIDPDRVGRVLKHNRDTMMKLADDDPLMFQALLRQAEADMGRCTAASATLREVANQLIEVMTVGYEIAVEKRIKIP